MNTPQSISLEAAINMCQQAVLPLATESVAVEKACGRISAVQIAAKTDMPDFFTSAVDGYTVHDDALGRLSAGEILSLKIVGQLGAGYTTGTSFQAGETLRIMTGAMIPENTAAVLKQEDVKREGDIIHAGPPLKKRDNIFQPGRDIGAGQVLVKRGQKLGPQSMEFAASCGFPSIEVYKIPHVYVINSGTELINPGLTLLPGQIHNSNRSLVAGLVTCAGGIPLMGDKAVPDDYRAIRDELLRGLPGCSMAIITGGTGDGDYDVVTTALQHIGAQTLFKGLDLAPGQGASAAVWQERLIFNFTGNPGAVSLLFEVLVRPVMEWLTGREPGLSRWITVALETPLRKISDRRNLRKGELLLKDGLVTASPLDKHCFPAREFAQVILDIPSGQGQKGDKVRALITDDY